ncbi:hypothetical protein CYMTET_4227, partial [Cymbomonas tetramitiformis]
MLSAGITRSKTQALFEPVGERKPAKLLTRAVTEASSEKWEHSPKPSLLVVEEVLDKSAPPSPEARSKGFGRWKQLKNQSPLFSTKGPGFTGIVDELLKDKRHKQHVTAMMLNRTLQKPSTKRTVSDLRNLASLVVAFKFLSEAPPGIFFVLAKFLTFLKLPADKPVFHKGQDASNIYLVLSGECVQADFETGGARELLGKGKPFGMDARVPDSKRIASVRTRTDVDMAVVTGEDIKLAWKFCSSVPDDKNSMQRLLSKPRKTRTPDDLKILSAEMLRFKKLAGAEESLRQEICRMLEYVLLPAGQPVFLQGDEGDLYYVILSGRVSVSIAQKGGEKKVADLGPGDEFGELALLKSQARAASVTTTEIAEFAVLSKWGYEKTMKKHHNNQLKDRAIFLKSLQAFSNATATNLYRHSYYFQELAYVKNAAVLEQGKPNAVIYFIEEGECRVLKKVAGGSTSKPSLMQIKTKSMPKNVGRTVEICLLGPKDMFGENSLCHNEAQNFTVKANTAVKLWSIQAQHITYVLSSPIIDQIKMVAEEKERFYESRVTLAVEMFRKMDAREGIKMNDPLRKVETSKEDREYKTVITTPGRPALTFFHEEPMGDDLITAQQSHQFQYQSGSAHASRYKPIMSMNVPTSNRPHTALLPGSTSHCRANCQALNCVLCSASNNVGFQPLQENVEDDPGVKDEVSLRSLSGINVRAGKSGIGGSLIRPKPSASGIRSASPSLEAHTITSMPTPPSLSQSMPNLDRASPALSKTPEPTVNGTMSLPARFSIVKATPAAITKSVLAGGASRPHSSASRPPSRASAVSSSFDATSVSSFSDKKENMSTHFDVTYTEDGHGS